MKARFNYFDANKDGYVSREDFQLLADNLVLYGKPDESKGKSVRARVLRLWECYGLPDGVALTEKDFLTHAASISGKFYLDSRCITDI